MKSNRFIRYATSAVAVISSLTLFCSCNKAPERVEPPPPKVSVQHPELRNIIDYDQYNGWLRASDTVDIRARVRGHLDKILFTDGDMVKKGQLLFELDPRPFQAEIGRAADQVKIYEAQLVAAQREEARFRELVQKGGASQSQVDMSEAQTKSLEAQIEASKEEVKRRELDLEYSRITSPLNGVIGRAMMSEGSLVNAAGSEVVLATVVTIDPIYVYFNIDERSLQRYIENRRGEGASTQPAFRATKVPFMFKLDTDREYPHKGVLDFADNRVDSSTGTIEIRGVVRNDKQLFVSGSRVGIRVPVSDEHQVMLVPDTAILTDQNRKYLLVLDDKKVVQRRDIEPGKLLDDQMRVIRTSSKESGGIKPDDWIITQGLQMARINYPVEPIMPASTTTTQPAAPTAAAK